MYTYERAAEAVEAMKKEIMTGNLFSADAIGLATAFADTIGWWESASSRSERLVTDHKNETKCLRDALIEKHNESAGMAILSHDLRVERDQLIDDNTSLADENAKLRHTVDAITSVLEMTR